MPEIHAEKARALLRTGVPLLAPDLIWAEFGNVLWKKWRQGQLDVPEVSDMLRDFSKVPLEIYSSGTLRENAWLIAHVTRRSYYDSLYLALAIQTRSALITADHRFYQAIAESIWSGYCVWIEDAV